MIPKKDIVAEGTWGNRHFILTDEPCLIIRTHNSMYDEASNSVIQMETLCETILQGAEIQVLRMVLEDYAGGNGGFGA